jgi:hypothetical protein
MKLIPQQYYLLIRICDTKADSKIITVNGTAPKVMPFGEVLAVGPDCKFVKPGDKVLFNLENMIGFETLKQFLIAEGGVFAKLELEGEEVHVVNVQ